MECGLLITTWNEGPWSLHLTANWSLEEAVDTRSVEYWTKMKRVADSRLSSLCVLQTSLIVLGALQSQGSSSRW